MSTAEMVERLRDIKLKGSIYVCRLHNWLLLLMICGGFLSLVRSGEDGGKSLRLGKNQASASYIQVKMHL